MRSLNFFQVFEQAENPREKEEKEEDEEATDLAEPLLVKAKKTKLKGKTRSPPQSVGSLKNRLGEKSYTNLADMGSWPRT